MYAMGRRGEKKNPTGQPPLCQTYIPFLAMVQGSAHHAEGNQALCQLSQDIPEGTEPLRAVP